MTFWSGADRALVAAELFAGSFYMLMLALHALSQGWAGASAQQNWEALAPSGHFVVVYGVGQPNASWNAGLCCSTAAR